MDTPVVPDLTETDVVFGNVKHLPPCDSIPPEFKTDGNPYVDFVSEWFTDGLNEDKAAKLKPKPGIDHDKALRAIRAILSSFAPKHDHKLAGCAYLLAQWFDFRGKRGWLSIFLRQ